METNVEEARERWLAHEESGLVDDLAKEGLYSRKSRYPETVHTLIEYLITNKYGRRHPNIIVAGRPRIDLPFTARDLAKQMLREHKKQFLDAMANTTWRSSGMVNRLPHHTFIEKHIRTMKHVKYDSYFGEYFSCKHCLEKDKSWKAVVSALGDEHTKWSPNCQNGTCPCGALQHNRNIRLRNQVFIIPNFGLNNFIHHFHTQKINHRACTGRCCCKDCTALFDRMSSFRLFLYHVNNKQRILLFL